MKDAITFRDVLLVPQRSSIHSRKDVDTTGRFSRRLNGRQQQPDQHADDGDHNQEFHQREAATARILRLTDG